MLLLYFELLINQFICDVHPQDRPPVSRPAGINVLGFFSIKVDSFPSLSKVGLLSTSVDKPFTVLLLMFLHVLEKWPVYEIMRFSKKKNEKNW